jgi:hypothetical protein
VKLEFLDISLNTWSIIIFLFQAIFYTAMTFLIFGGLRNKVLFIFILIAFVLNQVLFIFYGIVTGQIGFILLVVFQLFLIFLTNIYINFNNETEEEYVN